MAMNMFGSGGWGAVGASEPNARTALGLGEFGPGVRAIDPVVAEHRLPVLLDCRVSVNRLHRGDDSQAGKPFDVVPGDGLQVFHSVPAGNVSVGGDRVLECRQSDLRRPRRRSRASRSAGLRRQRLSRRGSRTRDPRWARRWCRPEYGSFIAAVQLSITPSMMILIPAIRSHGPWTRSWSSITS